MSGEDPLSTQEIPGESEEQVFSSLGTKTKVLGSILKRNHILRGFIKSQWEMNVFKWCDTSDKIKVHFPSIVATNSKGVLILFPNRYS